MTRLRKILASVESATKAIEAAGYGKSLVAYIDNKGEGFYISYVKRNKPQAAKNDFIWTFYLTASNNPQSPITKEDITDLKNVNNVFNSIEDEAITRITQKSKAINFERKVLVSQTKDFTVLPENHKWEETVDKQLSVDEKDSEESYLDESYCLVEYTLDKKEKGSVVLRICYEPEMHKMYLNRENPETIIKTTLIEEPSQAQSAFDNMVKMIVSAAKDLVKDNNLHNLQSETHYEPEEFDLPLNVNSSAWADFCVEFGNKQQEETKKKYREENKSNGENKEFNPKEFKKDNMLARYRGKGVTDKVIYAVEDALCLVDVSNRSVISTEYIVDEGDYQSAFEKLETDVIKLLKESRQDRERVYRDINHPLPVSVDVDGSKPWSKFLEQEQKYNKKEDKDSKEDNSTPTPEPKMEVDENGSHNNRDDNYHDKKLPHRKKTYPNQKLQRDTITIEIKFEEPDLNVMRAFIKDMINKKLNFNYSITEVTAKTFTLRKVLALVRKNWKSSRLRKVAEFAINDAKEYLTVDLNININNPSALYSSSQTPDSNKCLGIIVETQGKFLGIGPDLDDDGFYAVGEALKKDKPLEEALKDATFMKLFSNFDEAEAWVIQQNGKNIMSKQAEESKQESPRWKEYIESFNAEDKKDKEPEKPKLMRLRMHFVPTTPITDYINKWLDLHEDIVKNPPAVRDELNIQVPQESTK